MRKAELRVLFSLLLVLALLLPLNACSRSPSTYSAEAIDGWVIDGETKKPIEGVIVTANWQLESGNVGGSVVVGQMMVMETVTDKNGRFYFSAWGPKRREKGFLGGRDPQLLFFKSGYRWTGRINSLRKGEWKKPVRRSEWNGRKIELQKFIGSDEEYAQHLSGLNAELYFAIGGPHNCAWKEIPRMILAVQQEKKHFMAKGIHTGLFSVARIPDRGCGSPAEFFRSYKK